MPELDDEPQNAELNALRQEYLSLCREHTGSRAVEEARLVRVAVLKTLIDSHGDPWGDGDQAPLLGTESLRTTSDNPLRTAWASGLDYWEAIFSEKHAMSIHRSAWQGDAEDVAHEIAAAHLRQRMGDSNAMKRLLESRVSQMRLTPLHYACLGARRLRHADLDSVASCNIQTIVELLCAAGARVNARDIGGVTPLGLAAGHDASPISASLIPILLSHGADPNLKCRFGDPLIMQSIVSKNPHAFRTFLRAGALLDETDAAGLSPAHFIGSDPMLTQIVIEHNLATYPSQQCASCGTHGATKRCSACRSESYCSRSCQVVGWRAGHDEECTRRFV